MNLENVISTYAEVLFTAVVFNVVYYARKNRLFKRDGSYNWKRAVPALLSGVIVATIVVLDGGQTLTPETFEQKLTMYPGLVLFVNAAFQKVLFMYKENQGE